MVRLLEFEAQIATAEAGTPAIGEDVLAAMRKVPRHVFVPPEWRMHAYGNHPLPLGFGQNLSAPFVLALMIEVAEIDTDSVVFETGTDTGYMAALLGELVREVYSVEVIEPLAEIARAILGELGYDNVHVRFEDGYFGWAEHAPYDAIIVKEAIDHVPRPLLEQLAPGGRLVMPLGPEDGPQQLTVVTRATDGSFTRRDVLPVRFAPLQGGERT